MSDHSTETIMTKRIDIARAGQAAYRTMAALEQHVRASGLEHSLVLLVKLRASYINGCSYCVDMHSKDARAEGETEQRIYAVPVWRETPFFTPRERAALEWAETVTKIAERGVPDDVYESVHSQFTDEEMVNLTMAVVAINGWNRLAIAFAAEPGSYQRPGSEALDARHAVHEVGV
jgi:AhpD family alkylhydroperoxidase